MSFKTRLFVILLTAGLAGVFSILLVDLSAVVALLPIPAGTEIPPLTPAIKLLSLIQPGILLALAVLAGVALAHRVGLASPAAEAAASGSPVGPALKPQIVPGIIGGLLGGGAIVAVTLLVKPFLSAETVARVAAFGRLVPSRSQPTKPSTYLCSSNVPTLSAPVCCHSKANEFSRRSPTSTLVERPSSPNEAKAMNTSSSMVAP